MSDRSLYFDVGASGSAVFLGSIESTLMELAWRQGDLTVKRALALLGPESDLAYTTVMTVLNRLTAKGLLRREKDGRLFRYHPAVSRQQFLSERVGRILDCLSENFPDLI